VKEQNEYLKIKDKYEAVLFELMKEVSNKLNNEDCNCLYKEMAITLVAATLDFDNSSVDEIIKELVQFSLIMHEEIIKITSDIKHGKFEGKVIKHYD
jgi:predicted transcriptional regulator